MFSTPRNKRNPTYLVRNPHSYCFRMNVPRDLQPYVGKKELRYSLETGYLGVAKFKARYVASHVQLLFRYIRRNRAIMGKFLEDQIPVLVKQYIKDRLEYLENMYTDTRYLKERDSYHYDGDDIEGFIENTRDNMASLRYQMAHYCRLYLSTGDVELEMLAENIRELLKKNDVKSIDNDSPEYKALSTEIHDAEVQILPLEADRLNGAHSYKQEMLKLFPFLKDNAFVPPNGQPELKEQGKLLSEVIELYIPEASLK